MPPSVIAGPYLADLLAQPDALRALRESIAGRTLGDGLGARLREGQFRRVLLTGMGASLHALYPLHLQLIAHDYASLVVETSELLIGYRPQRAKDTLLIAVSQSGESAEIVSLLKFRNEFGHVIGVTNNPASTLARASGTVLPLHAGIERTVSCKTYIATLGALHWVAAELTGRAPGSAVTELESVEASMRTYLEKADDHVAFFSERVANVRTVFVTGRGVSLATAWTGGLILKESTRQPAEGMSCAAFRHGPFEMIGEEVLVLVLAGDESVAPLHRRLATDIIAGGGQAVLIGTAEGSLDTLRLPTVPTHLLPLMEILPVQMLSLALAARDGREAGRFERATKVTTAD